MCDRTTANVLESNRPEPLKEVDVDVIAAQAASRWQAPIQKYGPESSQVSESAKRFDDLTQLSGVVRSTGDWLGNNTAVTKAELAVLAAAHPDDSSLKAGLQNFDGIARRHIELPRNSEQRALIIGSDKNTDPQIASAVEDLQKQFPARLL